MRKQQISFEMGLWRKGVLQTSTVRVPMLQRIQCYRTAIAAIWQYFALICVLQNKSNS
jgi:hypothetical protein